MRTVLLLSLLFTCACASPRKELLREFDDSRPAYVPGHALDSVIPIYDEARTALGSGIIIGADRLLTAQHLFGERLPRGAQVARQVDGTPMFLTLLDSAHLRGGAGDWALFTTREPRWSAEQIAAVHGPALDPTWEPALGTQLLLAGYAAGLIENHKVDPQAPTPCVLTEVVATPSARATDEAARHVDDWCADAHGVALGGMSGGGAFVWVPERSRAELIGVFVAQAPVATTSEKALRFFGWIVWTWNVERIQWIDLIQPLPGDFLGFADTRRMRNSSASFAILPALVDHARPVD